MAGVHGLQHIKCLFTAALADDDAIGPHSQRVLQELALKNLTFAFGIGWARFEASDVGWSAGAGALVRGPGAALAFAMTGRTQTLDELTGDGVAVLRAR